MVDNPIDLMRAIKTLIESLPRKPDELGHAAQTEQRIAVFYLRLGDETAAGDWWVRAALEAEKYHQIYEAKLMLDRAARELPNHLSVRRESKRITERYEAITRQR